jgi:hypothetical protein
MMDHDGAVDDGDANDDDDEEEAGADAVAAKLSTLSSKVTHAMVSCDVGWVVISHHRMLHSICNLC